MSTKKFILSLMHSRDTVLTFIFDLKMRNFFFNKLLRDNEKDLLCIPKFI